MRILKICLGILVVILGIIVVNKYQSNQLSLEKESYMDTVFANDKPIELKFSEYSLVNKVSEFSSTSSYTKIETLDEKYSIYKSNDKVYGVDETRDLKLFEVTTTNLVDELCSIEEFKNVLGKDGIRFTFVDDRGERTMYFYENTDENTMVLLADELNVSEMYLGNEYKSLVTTDSNGFVNSIITKDKDGVVSKGLINIKSEEENVEIIANHDEDTFIVTQINRNGYTQTSPYIYRNYELQPYYMEVRVDAETKEDKENKASEEKIEDDESIVNESEVAYPIYEYDSLGNNDFVTSNGTVLESYSDNTSLDLESNIVNMGNTEVNEDGSVTFTTEESFEIARRENSNYIKLTGYVDEKFSDEFTYIYYKINDDYYAVKNVERNNYCFINSDGVEVTSFKFYNEPKAFGDYIFVQDDKEAYFLNENLEKVPNLPSLKGYYEIKSFKGAFVATSTLGDGKVFVANSAGELLYESNISSETEVYDFDKNDGSVIKDTLVVYSVTPRVYNSAYNYNGVYTQITGLENIVAEEEINHSLKKYVVEAVDNYDKNTKKETALINRYIVYQETKILNNLLIVKQTQSLENISEPITQNTNYYYFDLETGKELFVKDIFKEGYETRVLEELNKIANNENTKLTINIDKIGKFNLDVYGNLYVAYEKGELIDSANDVSAETAYLIELPLESVSDVINYDSDTFKAFSKNSNAFSGFVPNQTIGLMNVNVVEEDGLKIITTNVFYPQFVSNGDDVYKTINEYYQAEYETLKAELGEEAKSYLSSAWSSFSNVYLSEKFLQVKITRMDMGANFNVNYINDLWNLETGEKLDLYSIFNLEPEETEEMLDQLIYEKAKAFYDSKDYNEELGYDETTWERYGLLDIYKKYTTETGERVTEVGSRAIDDIDFNNDWYLTNEGLVLVYQEYVLSGDESDFKLFIPFEEINAYLTDEIKESLKLNEN